MFQNQIQIGKKIIDVPRYSKLIIHVSHKMEKKFIPQYSQYGYALDFFVGKYIFPIPTVDEINRSSTAEKALLSVTRNAVHVIPYTACDWRISLLIQVYLDGTTLMLVSDNKVGNSGGETCGLLLTPCNVSYFIVENVQQNRSSLEFSAV